MMFVAVSACAQADGTRADLYDTAILRDITVASYHGASITGTLSIPKHCMTRCPFFVLIPGGGPANRDGDFLQNHDYLDLAAGLAARGIGMFRYDKPGIGPGALQLTHDELLNVALAALDATEDQVRTLHGKIFVMGHSEGGEFALELAKRRSVEGLVLLSPLPMPYAHEFERQLRRHPENGALTHLWLTSPLVASFKGVDPVTQLCALGTMPILLVHGKADPTITDNDLSAFISAGRKNPNFSFVDFPLDDHYLFPVDLDETVGGLANTLELLRPQTVDPMAIDSIADWVTKYNSDAKGR